MKANMRIGIAMIELIFTIVILGIVILSAPMLISTSKQSTITALQQEAISTTAAEIGMILTYHWDEGDTNTTNSSPILVTLGDNELNEITDNNGTVALATGRMAGTPTSSARTFTIASALSSGSRTISTTVPAALGIDINDAGIKDDIDDFSGTSGLTDYNSTNASIGDTIDTAIILTTTVRYIDDTNSYNANSLNFDQPFTSANIVDSSNIKHIQVRLTTTTAELTKNILLQSFSCNIGTYKLNEGSL